MMKKRMYEVSHNVVQSTHTRTASARIKTYTSAPSKKKYAILRQPPQQMILIFFFRSRQLRKYLTNCQYFMEPEGSLPCSQDSFTDPYPEPDQLIPHHLMLFLNIHFNIILYLRLLLPYLSLSFGVFHQNLICIPSCPIRATCPAHRILLDLIILIKLSKSTCYKAPHYAVVPNLPSLHFSSVLSTLFSNSISLCSSLNARDQDSHLYRTTTRITVLYILRFTFLDSRREDIRF
jgi:hypothetical protein